jgi:hypothetical protein
MRHSVLLSLAMFCLGILVSGKPTSAQTPCPITPDAAATSESATATATLANDVGTRLNPVPFGTKISRTFAGSNPNKTWELTVVKASFGKDGEKAVKAANQFNDAPVDGNTNLVAYVQLKYVSGPSDKTVELDAYGFSAYSDGQIMPRVSIVPPKPAFSFKGFPGATAKGWVAFQVFSDDPAPELVWVVDSSDDTYNIYFATK